MTVTNLLGRKMLTLVHASGKHLRPVMMRSKETGKTAFHLYPSGGNTASERVEIEDEALMVERVVKDGWAVRAVSPDGQNRNSYGLGRRSITGYHVAP